VERNKAFESGVEPTEYTLYFSFLLPHFYAHAGYFILNRLNFIEIRKD
jgi:hypothetical protein